LYISVTKLRDLQVCKHRRHPAVSRPSFISLKGRDPVQRRLVLLN